MTIFELNKKLVDLKTKKGLLIKNKENKEKEQKDLKEMELENKSIEELEDIKTKLEEIVADIEVINADEETVDEEITEVEEEVEKYYKTQEELKQLGKEVKELKPEKEKLKELTQSDEYMKLFSKALESNSNEIIKEYLRSNGVSEKTITTATTGAGNGGVVIPSFVADKIETEIKDNGGLLAAVNKVSFKGGYAIPLEVAGISAKLHQEGTNKDAVDPEFATIEIDVDFIYTKVTVTTKMEALDSGALATYIMEQLPKAVVAELEKRIVNGLVTDKVQGIKTADDKFVTKINGELNLASVMKAFESVRNVNVIFMNRKTWVAKFMSLTDANNQPLQVINYSIETPAVYGTKVVITDALADGEAIVGNGENYTLNLVNGSNISIDRNDKNKFENNTIDYLTEILCGGAVSKLNGFAFVNGVVTP